MVDSAHKPLRWDYWLWLLVTLLALKALLFQLDPDVGFFLGDSATYLYTAVEQWIPPDRSWTFGYFVAEAIGPERSLERLVIIQVLLNVLSCLLLALVLIRFLRCSPGIAAAAAMLCAVEPIQLLFERYVMAETLSLLVFAVFMVSLLSYLRRGHLGWLFVAALLAVAAASLRTAYLPVVLGLSVMAVLYYGLFCAGRDPDNPDAPPRLWRKLVTLVAHAGVFVVLFSHAWALERAQVKDESHTGYYLLASWSPLLADAHFKEDPELQWLFEDLPCTVEVFSERVGQMWLEDCLLDRIGKHYEGKQQRADFATGLAGRILSHDPLGVLDAAWRTWIEPWDDGNLFRLLRIDRGREPETEESFVELMDEYFNMDVTRWNHRKSLTKDWYDYNVWWYRGLLLAPFLLILWWLFTLRTLNPYSLMIAAAATSSLLVVNATVTLTSMRFYHAIAWLSIIGLASIVDRLVKRLWHQQAADGEIRQQRGESPAL